VHHRSNDTWWPRTDETPRQRHAPETTSQASPNASTTSTAATVRARNPGSLSGQRSRSPAGAHDTTGAGRVQRVVRRRVFRPGVDRCHGAVAAVGVAACSPLEFGLAAPPVVGPSKVAAPDEEQASLDRPCYTPMLRLTNETTSANPATNRRAPTTLQTSTAVATQPPGLKFRMLPLSV